MRLIVASASVLHFRHFAEVTILPPFAPSPSLGLAPSPRARARTWPLGLSSAGAKRASLPLRLGKNGYPTAYPFLPPVVHDNKHGNIFLFRCTNVNRHLFLFAIIFYNRFHRLDYLL